ncbi:MAG: hypothetical protein ACW98A_14800 [Candidatus Hodarchaeales archaeon]|jgi:hypothetical protein
MVKPTLQTMFMRSIQSLYCSLCGNRVTEVDVRICRHCGIIICNDCLLRQTEENSSCTCGSSEFLTLEEMKSLIISDFIRLKKEIREVAFLPVTFIQDLRQLKNKLQTLEQKEFVIPNVVDFKTDSDIDVQLSKVDTYLTHYLQDFSPSLAYLFNEVIVPLDPFFLDPLRIQSSQMRIKIISDRLKVFKFGTETRCEPLFKDVEYLKGRYQKYMIMVKRIKKFFKLPSKILLENEKIIYFSSIQRLYGKFRSNKQFILITTNRVLFFKQKRNFIFKKYNLVKAIDNLDLKEVKIRERRRFKKRILNLITNDEILKITGSKENIKNIKNSISNFSLQESHLTVSDWKLWIQEWSPEQFRLNVIQLINNTNENINSNGQNANQYKYENVFFNNPEQNVRSFSPDSQNVENPSIKKYFTGQVEKIQEQIQICQYFLQDLVDRRSELQLSEYYQMYESFSMKLRNLEDQRDEIIKQYEKLMPFMSN